MYRHTCLVRVCLSRALCAFLRGLLDVVLRANVRVHIKIAPSGAGQIFHMTCASRFFSGSEFTNVIACVRAQCVHMCKAPGRCNFPEHLHFLDKHSLLNPITLNLIMRWEIKNSLENC
ncbi:hypothetical protein POVWA2_013130 [Plasmodium ovale wallikeri]|uniref:Secreted protein n=1 Tax=Plasmodium ovale wallikeri TaxID=864142 RepID=A0A1A8YNP0_PLAOA|nr:hypothetical protein POVWA1_012460 [Plasmodium ovale wallikeri]SBT33126.1 hypothetical protein POVWA2_013130 [Plasmodium ovale wallikeri]